MNLSAKVALMLTGLTLSVSTNGLAAAADSLTDVPKDHWSYEALDYLAEKGVIEGYSDGTFQGNRAMSRYEMAAIVAKAMQSDKANGLSGAVLEKLETEYQGELASIKNQVAENTKQIEANKSAIERVNLHGFVRTQWDNDTIRDNNDRNDRRRVYLNLYGDFKVNKNFTAKFQSETNRHYARNSEVTVNPDGSRYYKSHKGNDGSDQGTIQRVWVDGSFDGGKWLSVGRTWRGLGFQNILYGVESDSLLLGMPINKQGLQVGAFYMSPSDDGTDFTMTGLNLSGPVGHSVDINLAYAKLNKGKDEDLRTDGADGNWIGSQAYVLSTAVRPAKNLEFIADYARTNHDGDNSSTALRLNYKGTNLDKPGSFGIYTRYVDYGLYGSIHHDDEWGSLQTDSKGWIFGFKYVPAKNLEWETLYEHAKMHPGASNEYIRNLFRTQMDFHF